MIKHQPLEKIALVKLSFYLFLSSLLNLLIVNESVQAKSLQDLFQQVNPSVVLIKASQRELSGIPGDRRPVAMTQLGSGVLIDGDRVITASHIVHTADQVVVKFLNGENIKAKILITDQEADLALLKLQRKPKDVDVVELANSDRANVGEEVFVIGAPYGIQHSLTAGIISARHDAKDIKSRMPIGEFLQTDTAINVGHSGGPVFNMDGDVIGIVSYIVSKSGGFEGIGFAVTSNTVKELLLSGHGMWTGLQGYPLDKTLAAVFNLPQPGGILVEKVAKGSISDRLGLRAGGVSATIEGKTMIVGGDVILDIMGIPLHGGNYYEEVRQRMSLLISEDKIYVKILRAGKVMWLSTEMNKKTGSGNKRE